MFRILLYPFEAVFFTVTLIMVTVLFCLDMMLFTFIMGLFFVFKAHNLAIKTSYHIEDSLEAASSGIAELAELSYNVLSKKQNKEKSNS